jgi:iron complex outermembrane receptor protein
MFQRTKICSGLLIAFGGLAALAPSAFAQDDQSVQRVEITGSSIKRVDAETAVPVTVIKADDLKKQGITTVEQILQTVSAVQVQQSSSQAVGAGTGGASFADMRGLGANKTLVLLNGRRIANQAFDSSAPDLNLIPFAAIERVEVLRDGASALYGTDAISGVINFITRRDYRGGTITLGVDHPQRSGGGSHSANMGFGIGDLQKDGLNILGFVDFQKQDQVLTSQRPYYQQQYLKNGVFAPSGTTFPATWIGTVNQFPNDAGGYAATPNSNGCANSQHLYQRGDPSDPLTQNQCGEITSDFIDWVPASKRISGLLRGSFKLGENNTLGLEAYTAQSKVTSRIAPVPYGALYMHSSNPFYPGKGITPLPPGITLSPDQMGAPGALNDDALFIKYRDVINGYREDSNTATQSRFIASLEGNAYDWDYNVAASLNTNHVQDYLSHGYTDINILAPQDLNPNSATYGAFVIDDRINPFGPQTPEGAAVLASAVKRGIVQYGNGTVQTIDGHASHDLPDWLKSGRPGAIAIGFEGRHERFVNTANPEYAAQVVASTGIDPGTYNAGWRNVWAGFAEWNLPILKSLDFTLSARYDHYSDFGNTTNPKASFRWQPSKLFLLRGSYSTGFRAPSLYELNAAQTYGNSSGGQNDPLHSHIITGPDGKPKCVGDYPQACNNQFEVLTGGNTELKPEKSKNFTLGTVLEPVNDFTAEFDYYNIKFTNQISVVPDSDLFDPAQFNTFQQYYHYNANGQLSTDGTQCPGTNCGYVSTLNQNLGAVHTDGVDMAFSYRANAGSLGKLNFGLQSTWVHSFKFQNVPNGEYIQNVGVYQGASPIFRWQHNGEINWNFEPFSVGWAIHYKAGYDQPAGTFANANLGANPDYKVSSYTTMDLFGTYAMPKGFSLTVGVRNLADSKAPFSYQTSLFQTGYDPRYSDTLGRTYYARGTYSF